MKAILVPVNFSASSDNAARYAADLAIAMHADLHLLHVLQVPVSTAEFPLTDSLFEEMQDSASEALSRIWEELIKRTKAGVHVFIHLETGAVEYQIEKLSQEIQPFAIIMGNPGNSLVRALSGSNIATAVRHLNYPVLVIPQDSVFRQIKRVVLACDLDDIAGGIPVPFLFLKNIRDLFGAGFEVINVCTPHQDKQDEAERTFEFNSWKEMLHEFFPEVHFIHMNNVESGISEYLEGHLADLLLVFPKKHGLFSFHQSHARKIALNSKVPIMSIHS